MFGYSGLSGSVTYVVLLQPQLKFIFIFCVITASAHIYFHVLCYYSLRSHLFSYAVLLQPPLTFIFICCVITASAHIYFHMLCY
jgi:cytochrome c oxidase subunit IV